ncbi:histidine biosynthesis bifunctional protein HisIE [Litorimonas cladophorae]|uniref:Histidine biosynthesis bifunctional protein HisIE n=1 Tax=Litorimonas cladophorae TaxID=1220491 RepID=A0A918NBU4_9PROT|nr:bifunctional phosphoribosyl-AMP cyclohydrolase/phosphoribosyl-ATP diphosphatase HisIE [Litorimonas cladophorae]GGX58952.1 histidine biosynthesis bifunctional protein HisIE [Litorimonas cladophorae]
MKIDFEKGGGLAPAIVQDADTLQVLMLGYMNAESVSKTNATGLVTFYSRSRKTLWTKGETSGNTLALVSMIVDCDRDTLLVKAKPTGPTCHEGTVSCFGSEGAEGVGFLSYLETLIEGRKTADPESSYTAQLLHGPLRRAAQKVGEEGVETALAAVAETDDKLVSEAADLIYHTLVLLAAKDLKLDAVVAELKRRH